jgi:hypothetical protein
MTEEPTARRMTAPKPTVQPREREGIEEGLGAARKVFRIANRRDDALVRDSNPEFPRTSRDPHRKATSLKKVEAWSAACLNDPAIFGVRDPEVARLVERNATRGRKGTTTSAAEFGSTAARGDHNAIFLWARGGQKLPALIRSERNGAFDVATFERLV